mgnify:CR=1 FL=1
MRAVLDLLGAAAAGMFERGPAAVRHTVRSTMAVGHVPIWFAGLSSSLVGAAWANAAAAAALDVDDGHRLARGHPGAAVVPTALAVGHETGAPWEQILASIVIGYEVGVTIAAGRLRYGNTGTWASYAVVATAAALRRTAAPILEHALAIAGESAPSQAFLSAPAQTPAPEGSDVKEGIPWSVFTGLVALDLAAANHTGPRNILEDAHNYALPEPLELGTYSHIQKTYFKLYACCRHIHAPLDALLGLIAHYRIDHRSIESIEVATYSGALRLPNKIWPGSLVDVQYSIRYCLALAARSGAGALLPLTPDALGRDDVSELAARVVLALDPELNARFPQETLARVAVVADGRRFASDVTAPRGEHTQPLTWSELEDKIRTVTRLCCSEQQSDALIRAVNEARAGRGDALDDILGSQSLAPC